MLAEKKLTFMLPNDYLEYLTKLGCGYASSEDFLGLGGESHLDMLLTYERLRKPSGHAIFPADYIPIKPDGFGNYDCIDTSRSSADKGAIVFWTHDESNEQSRGIIVMGFWEWFCKELESTQEFDTLGR
jgi:hypothetical protein